MYRSPIGTSGGLRERERQIASAVTIVAVVAIAAVVAVVAVIAVIAIAAIIFVVVVNDSVDVNGCIASASAPVVHVLPGQG